MSSIAPEIEEDRETLVGLMQRMDAPRNPVKQASGWIAEKASRLKFGHAYRQPNHGAFVALEALALGVHGKRSLWSALQRVANEYPSLASAHLDQLLVRAETRTRHPGARAPEARRTHARDHPTVEPAKRALEHPLAKPPASPTWRLRQRRGLSPEW